MNVCLFLKLTEQKWSRTPMTNRCFSVSFSGITSSFQTASEGNVYAEGLKHILSRTVHPEDLFLHVLFYLIFITAAQRTGKKKKKKKGLLGKILFCFDIDNIWMTMNLKRKKEQQRREKRKDWMSGVICTIYLLFLLFFFLYLKS